MKTVATKFVHHDIPELETLRSSTVYQLRKKLNNGDKINRIEKNWLANALMSNSYFNKAVPLRGYRFGFEDILRTYVVKQYGAWSEYHAPDKTSLRSILYGKVEQIVEVSKK